MNNGTTACKWDVVIPFEPLWEQYKRIIKDKGAIVLFGSEPFSSYLRMSNIKQYKYDWVWNKIMPTGFAGCKKTPMYVIENIIVFGNTVNYYPQMTKREIAIDSTNWKQDKRRSENARFTSTDDTLARKVYTEKYPVNYLEYNRANKECNNTVRVHPTQKPVALLEYLIKTYTLEGETVLDNCMGSFSTAIACLNTKRSFIGIEKDAHYFQVGKDRVEKHLITLDYNPQIVYCQV